MSGSEAVQPAGHPDLAEVLWPWSTTPLRAEYGPARVEDVPPDVMWAALGTVDLRWSMLRTRSRPPARWIVDQAVQREALLGARVDVGFASVLVDVVVMPVDRTSAFLAALERRWPGALGACDVELRPSWHAPEPLRRLAGGDVRRHLPDVRGAQVASFGWP